MSIKSTPSRVFDKDKLVFSGLRFSEMKRLLHIVIIPALLLLPLASSAQTYVHGQLIGGAAVLTTEDGIRVASPLGGLSLGVVSETFPVEVDIRHVTMLRHDRMAGATLSTGDAASQPLSPFDRSNVGMHLGLNLLGLGKKHYPVSVILGGSAGYSYNYYKKQIVSSGATGGTSKVSELTTPLPISYLTYGGDLTVRVDLGKRWTASVGGTYAFTSTGIAEPMLRFGIGFKMGGRRRQVPSQVQSQVPSPPPASTKDTVIIREIIREVAVHDTVKVNTERASSAMPKFEVGDSEVKDAAGKEPLPEVFVFFNRGSAYLQLVAKEKIRDFLSSVRPTDIIYLIGSADAGTGNSEINNALAEMRAKVVKDYIIERGIRPERVEIKMTTDIRESPEASRAVKLTVLR